ncbi:MAG: hypothetical protein NWS63_12645 [Saprospiraceae bacterium]|nr:hypothetical protein [Saprospiraceae bacterium]MDP4997615.1 hypothetical protein [Saprospiraceae bacterium]
MQMLTIVLGIIFILLLLSLLATTIMELVSSLMQLRGKNLERALRNMLASSDLDERILEAFKQNALYRQLSYRNGKKLSAPSYVSPQSFQAILMNILLEGREQNLENIRGSIDKLGNQDLREVLLQLLNESENKLDDFRSKVQGWYNDVMDRSTAWYKQNTQKLLVMIGFALAVVFNADTIAIYQRLGADPEALQQVVTMAEAYVAGNDVEAIRQRDPEFEQIYQNLKNLVQQDLEAARRPLGLGWDNGIAQMGPLDWLTKLLGWVVTALAVSLGAPFWFDLLKKIVNIRQSAKN